MIGAPSPSRGTGLAGLPAEMIASLLKACGRLKPAGRRRLIKAIDQMCSELRIEIRAAEFGDVLALAGAEDVLQALGLVLLDPVGTRAAVCTDGVRALDSERDSGSAIRGDNA
ncbi:MAG: hypothetical protein JWM02_3512 [Frankiales bacterium]|nr:hypothetical protein [Frankiales bacterium]